MAKYRKRRYRRRSRYSANIQEVNDLLTATPGTWSAAQTITTNPVQSATLVSQTYTIKNVEITFNLDHEGQNIEWSTVLEGITCYIMYVPQGMNVTNDYNIQHPEYIMAYKYIGSPTVERNTAGSTATGVFGQEYQPIRVKTRLARKLQTGDNVILFVKGVNTAQTQTVVRLTGLIRWWTKAN